MHIGVGTALLLGGGKLVVMIQTVYIHTVAVTLNVEGPWFLWPPSCYSYICYRESGTTHTHTC